MVNRYMIVVGTRPEIIKMAPILRAFKKESLPHTFVHCGQHYDYEMSQHFIDELKLPKPDYGFKVKTYSPAVQTGKIMILIENVVKKVKPDVVLVEGDTNGVLASALATVKLGAPVGHVEAGLRSFDLRMPEEYNRRLVDHISTYLFAPTENAKQNLKLENVWGKTFVTGNTVIDAVKQHLPLAKQKSKILDNIKFKKFALVTAHRAENVDNPTVLRDFVESFIHAPIPIVYPVHPRTRKQLHKQKLWKKLSSSKNVQLLPTRRLLRLPDTHENLRDDNNRLRRNTRRSHRPPNKKTRSGNSNLHRKTRSRRRRLRQGCRRRKEKNNRSDGTNPK